MYYNIFKWGKKNSLVGLRSILRSRWRYSYLNSETIKASRPRYQQIRVHIPCIKTIRHQEFDGKAHHQEIQKRLDIFLIKKDEVAEIEEIKGAEGREAGAEWGRKIIQCSIHCINRANCPCDVALRKLQSLRTLELLYNAHELRVSSVSLIIPILFL